MVQTSSLAAGQAMRAPHRGHISGVDERLVVRPQALATALPDPSVDLSLSQPFECSRHEKASTCRVDDINTADAGLE